ncbi:MAG: fibronectin type III domain-containing protein [Desulfuromonadales bacterium]
MSFIRLVIMLMMAALLGACSSGGGSSTSISTPVPGGGSVNTTLTIIKTNLSSNGTTTVKAMFMDGDKPIPGLVVNFSAPPDLAVFNPINGQVMTDGTGTAVVQMTATNSTGVGQVTVSATYNGRVITQLAPFYLNSPPLHLGNMTYNKSVTRGGSLVVSADILDSDGNLYTDQNVDVYFNSGYGRFVTDNNVGKVRSSGGKVIATYFTDFTFYPGSSASPYADSFTLTLGSSTLTGNLTIKPPAAVNIKYSTALPAKTSLGYNETMTFTFNVVDTEGVAAPDKLVSFVMSGTGANLQSTSAYTDRSGNAIATIKAGTANASVWVIAYLGSSSDPTAPASTSAVVSINPSPGKIKLGATLAATTLTSGQTLPISFVITDLNDRLAVPNQTVNFALLNLDGTPAIATNVSLQNITGTTDTTGSVSTVVVANSTATADSQVYVKATVAGTNISLNSPTITAKAPLTASGIKSTLPTSYTVIPAATASYDVKFQVYAKDGTAVPNVNVNFTLVNASGGAVGATTALLQSTSATTDSGGNVTATLLPKTVGADFYVKADVSAGAGAAGAISAQSVLLTITGTTTSAANLALALAQASPRPGDYITATVTYTNTNPSATLSGIPITIKSNYAAIADTSVTTDSTGKAIVNIQVPNTAKTGTVVGFYATNGTIQSATTTATISAAVAEASTLTLSMVANTSFVVNTTAVVPGNKATFVTSQGIPLVGQDVTFSIDRVAGWNTAFTTTLNGVTSTDSATPTFTPAVTMKTDTSGTVLLPTVFNSTATGTYVVYWRAVAPSTGATAFSSTVVSVNSPTAPSAPTISSVTKTGATTATVTFIQPASNGGSAITGYTVTCSSSTGGATGVDTNRIGQAGTTGLSHSITVMTVGNTYTCVVTAANGVGLSPQSGASDPFTLP